jgi:pimeloyl-ACP methyl ester carboxylesterase
MKPLFEHYRQQRPVYAPDLPGFGQSDRADRSYSPEFYAEVISAFLDEVVGEAADVVALSTSAEFAARASLTQDKVASLALISPTGFGARTPPGPATQDKLLRAFRTPALSKALYSTLTVKPSIRFFLNKNFVAAPPSELVDYAYRTTKAPGARHAPFHFLAMKLFTANAAKTLYPQVRVPTLVLYDKDPNISFERLPGVLKDCPNWRAARISPTLGMPHWEQPAQTVAAMDTFWASADG